jgi:hypothetical protein
MSRRSIKDLAREPLTVLSVMAGAALLALSLSASDARPVPSGPAVASANAAPTALDLRTGSDPRLDALALPGLDERAREAADCALAKARSVSVQQPSALFQRWGA